MRGSKAREGGSVHTVAKMENSVGRTCVWARCRADKQSLQEGVAAAVVMVVVVAAAAVERRMRSEQVLRTQKMA